MATSKNPPGAVRQGYELATTGKVAGLGGKASVPKPFKKGGSAKKRGRG